MTPAARVLSAVIALALATPATAAAPPPSLPHAAVDAIFARFTPATPGCTVGVERPGAEALTRAYGSADLEHGALNTPVTPVEAGSVSKQFTAASVLLLAQEGRLRLEDDIRAYIPELPDYGAPIRISDLIGHTSGLRDWGAVEELAGWPRGDRVYGFNDVLQITARQRTLNFPPGSAWSYTNTGYTLLAILVERVSGTSLSRFSQARLFTPLGMTHTQWRDNFRRIVPGRAVAYRPTTAGYVQDMPFENAYGNGGLISTVGDLLTWNRALASGRLGAALSAELQKPSALRDGQRLDYAQGLYLGQYRGVPEVAHAGVTAGYRAWLARYPREGLSIAILCNAADADATALGHRVADLYLSRAAPGGVAAAPTSPGPPASLAGWYANEREGAALHFVERAGRLVSGQGRPVERATDGALLTDGLRLLVRADGRLAASNQGDPIVFSRVNAFTPSAADLVQIVGRYHSDEIASGYRVSLDKGALRFTNEERPDFSFEAVPAYTDAFAAPGLVVRLVRGAQGRIVALRLSNERVWNLRLDRVSPPAAPEPRPAR